MNMPYFKDPKGRELSPLGQLERIAAALERIAKYLEQSCEDDAELAKTIPCDEDESYPASPEDIRIMRANPDPLDVAEEG
jgi:hypothetical protein